ncbi:Para-hydroxybenzoate--polyprenyltransferase, mitochondrial precursor (PHB:polyprenyltransferase) [Pseudocyphellaria aurata]|nr:Para-hydroxybenzoate--polyprenyltransferase, mitochondrial precursor (PHB:polyprenyltransferase) [Pseudocyphellaria aurata]
MSTATATKTSLRSRCVSSNIPNELLNGVSTRSSKDKTPVISISYVDELPSYLPPTKGFLSILPAACAPYAQLMRLEKPGGFYAFYFPCVLGLLYAACIANDIVPPTQLLRESGFFLLGAIILRGAACTWNDNIDQDFDRQVARCRLRPIARGAVSSSQGHLFVLCQTLIGSALLARMPFECTYDAIPIALLFGIYPFGKRFTNYPQFILGFPFAWAIVMSCHAIGVDPLTSKTLPSTICLVLANVAWTMVYDTIYAHQDIKDDIDAGVKSMAVRFKDSTKLMASGLGIVLVSLLVTALVCIDSSCLCLALTCGGTAISLAAMIGRVDLATPASCAWWFKWGFWFVGGAMMSGFSAQYLARLA